jgi:hypothetical protein
MAIREIFQSLPRPRWSGEVSDWRQFWIEWEFYWKCAKSQVGSKYKAHIFIKCLPYDQRKTFNDLIIRRKWKFEQIANHLHSLYNTQLTTWDYMKAWRACPLKGRAYIDFVQWWYEWEGLGSLVQPLMSEDEWIRQFCVSVETYHKRYLEDIAKTQFVAMNNERMTLLQMRNLIVSKLMIKLKSNHLVGNMIQRTEPQEARRSSLSRGKYTPRSDRSRTSFRSQRSRGSYRQDRRSEYRSRENTPSKREDACHKCGERGHWARECPHGKGKGKGKGKGGGYKSSYGDRSRSESRHSAGSGKTEHPKKYENSRPSTPSKELGYKG